MANFSIQKQQRAVAVGAWTAALALLCALTGPAVVAAANPGGDAGGVKPPHLGASSSRVDTSVRLESRGITGGGAPQVVIGDEPPRQAPSATWDCPTGVWVLVLERDTLEQVSSTSYPMCSKSDGARLTRTLKALSPEDEDPTDLVVVNSVNHAPGGTATSLIGLGAALATIGVPKNDFESLDLANTAFSVVGVPQLSARQAYSAVAPLGQEAGLAAGVASPASINASLAVDNHGNYAVTMRDYALYDIGADGSVLLDGHTIPTPAVAAGFTGGFHVVAVDRRSLAVISNKLYSTHASPAGQFQMASALDRLAEERGQSVLLLVASVGRPLAEGDNGLLGPVELPERCSGSAGFTVTCSYPAIEAEQHFTVPASSAAYPVSSLHVVAQGGFGGDTRSRSVTGGHPDRVTADVPVGDTEQVKPGSTLYVEVGGNGDDDHYAAGGDAGWNGGGIGGRACLSLSCGYPGAGGGGASDVRTQSRAKDNSTASLGTRLLVAAGGGGAAGGSSTGEAGGDGGKARARGEDGGANTRTPSNYGHGGGAATVEAGGSSGGARPPSPDGSLGTGGDGSWTDRSYGASGGGGGGLYGGGGGGIGGVAGLPPRLGGGGGGGGGSSLVPAGGTMQVATSKTLPSVTISYRAPYGALAQALRPFGATPEAIADLAKNPRYALAGALNTAEGVRMGLSPDSPESSRHLRNGATGRLQGVVQRGHSNMYYESSTSNVVLEKRGAAPTVANYGFYDVVAHVDQPWPVPAPGPRYDAQVLALVALSKPLCECDNLRDKYNNTGDALRGYAQRMPTTFESGHGFTQEDFTAVRTQLLVELDDATYVAGLKDHLRTFLLAEAVGNDARLKQTYSKVKESLKGSVNTSAPITVAMSKFFLELLTIAAEASGLEPVAGALGVYSAAFDLSTELTHDENGEDNDILDTTAAKLGDDTATQFAAAANSLSQTFSVVLSNWGRLSTVAEGVRTHNEDWDVLAGNNGGRVVSTANRASSLAYYRALLGVSYQRAEALGAPTNDMTKWCLAPEFMTRCTTVGGKMRLASAKGFKLGSSADSVGPHAAPGLDFAAAYNNILVAGDKADRMTGPLPDELMKDMKRVGLYEPYLFLRWQLAASKVCPVDVALYEDRFLCNPGPWPGRGDVRKPEPSGRPAH